jgi:flavin reductase (DIM6/NTAB) family NADH-FMN oxidoreductase RutF
MSAAIPALWNEGGPPPAALLGEPERWADHDPEAVPPDLLRTVLRQHAKGVAVITAGMGAPVGFCATSLASLSLDPPLLSFTVGLRSTSWVTMQTARYVMIHLLAENQEQIARRFAGAGPDKFGPATAWHRGPFNLPTLDGVLAWLVLAPGGHVPVGDHTLVIGRVVAAQSATHDRPLIHYDGRFAPVPEALAPEAQ